MGEDSIRLDTAEQEDRKKEFIRWKKTNEQENRRKIVGARLGPWGPAG